MNRVLFIIALGLLAIVGGPVATLCIVFLLPSIVAHLIRHPDTKLVMLINLTIGWTILGWVIAAALTMPCKTRTRDQFRGSADPELPARAVSPTMSWRLTNTNACAGQSFPAARRKTTDACPM